MSYNRFVPPQADIAAFLERLRVALALSKVHFSWKADDERLSLGWTEADVLDELANLSKQDFFRLESSRSIEFSVIWVFCPLLYDLDEYLWIRLVEDSKGTLIVSFHLAERNPWT